MAAKVYPEYQTRLREANAADFGDLLLWPTLALVNDADYRARGPASSTGSTPTSIRTSISHSTHG